MEVEDRYAALAVEAEKEEPEIRSWTGDGEGDESTVVGEVVRFEVRETKYGSANVVILQLQSNEEILLWLSRSVLKNEFQQWSPQPGELVAVAYLGEKQGANGTYHNYKVKVEGRSKPSSNREPDWSDSDAQTELAHQGKQDARDEMADSDIPF